MIRNARRSPKPKPPVKVRATTIRVRRSTVRDAIDAELDGAVRGALRRVYKYREDSLPKDAEEQIVSEVADRVGDVLAEWLDFGDES